MNKKYTIANSWTEDKWLIPVEEENENLEKEWDRFVTTSISEMIHRYENEIVKKGLRELEEVGCVKRPSTSLRDLMRCPSMVDSELYENWSFCCVEQNGILFYPLFFDCEKEELEDTHTLKVYGMELNPETMTQMDVKYTIEAGMTCKEDCFWMDCYDFCRRFVKEYMNLYFERMTTDGEI